VIEQRTGLKIGCLEEIAHSMKWIDDEKLHQQALTMNNEYGEYLLRLTGNQIGQ
jgi:glucose-1-phosphate thymidylyltransferase